MKGPEDIKGTEKREYCPRGKVISKLYGGPSSPQFAKHIKICNQCYLALMSEKPPTKH